jgi:dienelactone hydrolase
LPDIGSLQQTTRPERWWEILSWIPKSGRAFIRPVFEGTFERGGGGQAAARILNPIYRAELFVRWGKDLGRTIDYLESRGDIDAERIACLGFSLGAEGAPTLMAIEDRVKAAILVSGGFSRVEPQPAVDPLTFLPRVTQPVLMLNGRYDHTYPVESAQKPFFNRLGTPDDHKRYVLFDAAHGLVALPRSKMIKESLAWLDKYLGPVERAAAQ